MPALSPLVLDQLARNPLPGNVRELENLLQRAVALSDKDNLQIEPSVSGSLNQEPCVLSAGEHPVGDDQTNIPSDLQSHLDNQEREILIQALRETGFNRTVAAARLGISLRQMRYRIARLHIETPPHGDASNEAV